MSIRTILSDPVMDTFLISEWGELIPPFQRSRQRAGESWLAGTFRKILISALLGLSGALGLYFGLLTAGLTGEAPYANIWFDPFLLSTL